ncbi:MAG: DUF3082 domain-containing protein [Cyanobacteria bacterium CRU_2_1]|nr:DUF3082 domain-containing protein [Cyanobacteria bacterium CRU_2_1]
MHTNSPSETQKAEPASPTPLRCFTGAFIAGGLGYALYLLTRSIAEVFANKPLPTGNYVATNIAVAVRTLVVGMSTLGTAIFGISAVGLIALGIQLLIKQLRQPS